METCLLGKVVVEQGRRGEMLSFFLAIFFEANKLYTLKISTLEEVIRKTL
jgi:penicillin-binding protein-related factor A (putative recombinase)